jgi:hypothetical protein
VISSTRKPSVATAARLILAILLTGLPSRVLRRSATADCSGDLSELAIANIIIPYIGGIEVENRFPSFRRSSK